MVGTLPQWPLIGREGVLDRCRSAIAASRSVVIAGAAGMGKTRVAREISDELESAGRSVVRVQATEEGGVPLAALRPAARLDSILVVDDIHWLDDDAAVLLGGLLAQDRLVSIATFRAGGAAPMGLAPLWTDDRLERIDLGPLARTEVDAMLDEVLKAPVDARSRRQLWELTHGSPLFVRELLVSSIDDGSLTRVDGMWRFTGQPYSKRLDEVMAHRFEALADEARAVVELVAFGEPLGFEPLIREVGTEALTAAEESGLLETGIDGLRRETRLAHPLFGDAARRRVGEARAADVAGRLLSMIETTPMRRRDDVVRAAAWQLRSGGATVSPDMLLAARRAFYDHDDRLAIQLASRVTEVGGLEAAIVLGEALVELGQPAQAERIMGGVGTDGAPDAARALVAMERAVALFWGMGNAAAADQVLRDAQDHLVSGPWHDEVLAMRAVQLANRGELHAADELLTALPDPTGRVGIEVGLARSLVGALGGRADETVEIASSAGAARIEFGDEPVLADPGIFVVAEAFALTEAGRLLDADALARAGHETTVSAGFLTGQAWFSLVLGRIGLLRGCLDEADGLFREASGAFAALHSLGPRRWAVAGQVLVAALRGDLLTCEAASAELADLPDHPAQMMEGEVRRAVAWQSAATGQIEEAWTRLADNAEIELERGNLAIAAASLHDVIRLGGSPDPGAWERVSAGTGTLAALRLRLAEAVLADDAKALIAAADGFESIGAHLFEAEVRVEAAQRLRSAGDQRGAAAADLAAAQAQLRTGEEWFVTLDRARPAPDLTPREGEVARLAANGRSNREIADDLSLSVRTVENHLQHVYDKLGLRDRRGLSQLL